MIVHLARQDPCWQTGRVSASFLLAVSSKLFQLNGGQLHHDRLSVLKSARCLASSRVFVFLAAAGCCLVGNLVAPLLDGLNDLLNDGSLSDGPHGGSNVGGGLRESESVGNGGSDVRGRHGVSNGGNGSNGGSSGISGVGGGVTSRVTGKASVGVSVAKPVGVGHLRIGLSGGGGDSDGENDESEHDDLCWLGS